MSVSANIEKAIEDIAPSARALEAQVSEPDGIIIEANKKLATLNPRTEAWVDSGIRRTRFGYAQVPDHESPTKATWELAFDIEEFGWEYRVAVDRSASCTSGSHRTAALST
jgi:hypothetical protein